MIRFAEGVVCFVPENQKGERRESPVSTFWDVAGCGAGDIVFSALICSGTRTGGGHIRWRKEGDTLYSHGAIK